MFEWSGHRYLVLDVRDKEAYDEAHIDGALHYPKSMLSRGSNELLPGAAAY
jgi:rhodanese-related sulfurtransferase